MVVTGGAAGIGEAAVRAFAAAGATVFIAHIDTAAGEAPAAALPRATFVRTDVSQMADAERVIAAAEAATGRLDALFSNAGIQTYGLIENATEAHDDRSLSVNFKGHVWMCKLRHPGAAPRGRGRHRVHLVGAGAGLPDPGGALRRQQGRHPGAGQGHV